MSDGAIGSSHVTIPDLLEPVVGFRAFKVEAVEAKEAWEEVVWANNPNGIPFKEPNEFVTDPATGKLIRDYKKVAEAFEKWQVSLGEIKFIHHPEIKEAASQIKSPHREHCWRPGVMEATCPLGSTLHPAPGPECRCGYYSYYDWEKLSVGGSQIMGIVTQWGGIEAHSTGMRSQYMKIEALLGGDALRTLSREWFKAQEAPLMFYLGETSREEFVELASEFGSPLPAAMRPKPEITYSSSGIMQSLSTLPGGVSYVSTAAQRDIIRAEHKARYAAMRGVAGDISHDLQEVFTTPRKYKRRFDWGAFWFWATILTICLSFVAAAYLSKPGASPSSVPPTSAIHHQRIDFKAPLSSPTNSLLEPIR